MMPTEPQQFDYKLSTKQLEGKLVNIAVASYTKDAPTIDIVKYAAACATEFSMPYEARFQMMKQIIQRLI